MLITPFKRVPSREIYGADISGLQAAVNRCEGVLSLGTAAVSGYVMTAVADQAEPSLHRYIYEADIRGWLEAPAPVVRRNGVIVSAVEYVLHAAQGAVVFHLQQATDALITADFTHVTGASALTGHPARTDNPHAVTAAQSGATPIAHESATAVHSATAAATADRIILRDAAGRAQVATPAVDADIARLDTVVSLMSRFVMDY